jgi:hypothetical protein
MSGHKPHLETEKLIRCSVVTDNKKPTVRFIELNSFRLWEHLMISKHKASISDAMLCLWMNSDEFADNENIYSYADKTEPVNRIVVELFDEEYGFSNTVTRFVRAPETEVVIKILKSHIPDAVSNSELSQIQVYEGHTVEQATHNAKRPMILGLDY